MLAKDISSIKKNRYLYIYSRNNPQKSPRRIYYCASVMARPLRNCMLSIFMIHAHNYWLLFSSWFLFGLAVTYFVGTVVSWRTLALIGIFSSLFLLYKTEYICFINWILINFICRNYSMSCTTYRFIIIPESPRLGFLNGAGWPGPNLITCVSFVDLILWLGFGFVKTSGFVWGFLVYGNLVALV